MAHLKSMLMAIARTYQTHLLAYYAYELAKAFHHYYRFQRVIDPENIPQSRQRLAMVILTKKTLALCLELLGLQAPAHM